jgi:menaquinone-dependent protoporphyrinogen IX oxidase
MTRSILTAYATRCGSTGEVAEAIGDVILERGAPTDVRLVSEITDVARYDAVVLGCPIIYGKPHRDAVEFLRRHRSRLSRLPTAYFLCCLELTTIPESCYRGIPLVIDPDLGAPPQRPQRLGYFEKTHLVSTLIDCLLGAAPEVSPVGIAVFRGKMEYASVDVVGRLVLRLTRLLFSAAPQGDFRNWSVIRSWASTLPALLLPTEEDTP